MPSRLDDDHWLGARSATRSRHELRSVRYRLHIEQDRPAFWIAGEVVEHVAEVDIGHVAKRHDVGETNLSVGCPVDDGRDQRA